MTEHHEYVPPQPIAPRLQAHPKPHIGPGIDDYRRAHAVTVGPGSDAWWAQTAMSMLDWVTPFKTVRAGGFEEGDVVWFPEGTLNASYNCVDRWAFKNPDKVSNDKFWTLKFV